MSNDRKPIGFVEATVRFPLYEGDQYEGRTFDFFEYREPGITSKGDIGTCVRKVEVVKSEVKML